MKSIIIAIGAVVLIGGGVFLVMNLAEEDPRPEQPLSDLNGTVELPAGTDDLATVLARAGDIKSMRYYVEISSPESTTEMHFALKGNRIRGEMTHEGYEAIMLIDMAARTFYNYLPDQNMAFSLDGALSEEILGQSLVEQAHGLLSLDPVVVGRERVDGKDCLVVEYTVHDLESRMWIWERHGLPIRVDSFGPEGTVRASVRDIEFVDLPDSLFELPAGVQIMGGGF